MLYAHEPLTDTWLSTGRLPAMHDDLSHTANLVAIRDSVQYQPCCLTRPFRRYIPRPRVRVSMEIDGWSCCRRKHFEGGCEDTPEMYC